MNAGPRVHWYHDPVDDDFFILPLITANDNSVIAREVELEGEYLSPALELPLADFGLLEQDENFRSSGEETDAPSPPVHTTPNDDNAFTREVELEGEYLSPALELPLADFGLLEQDEHFRSSGEETHAPSPRVHTKEVNGKKQASTPAFHSCSNCALRFQFKSQLVRHYILRHGGEVEALGLNLIPPLRNRCSLCREEFPTVNQLATHLTLQHPESAVCNLCLTTFRDEATLEWHQKHHLNALGNCNNQPATISYICDICQKHCASSSQLHLHRKVHLKQTAYSCEHCGRSFSSSGNRRKHIARLHNQERKYHCKKCNESFIYPRQLRLHREREHAAETEEDRQTKHNEEQRAFVCEYCSKRFKQNTHLRNHLLTHTGVREYKCEFCAKPFAMAGDLRVHRRIHTKEKPFRCDLCPAAFIMGKLLNKHRLTVHHGKKGKCKETP
uniref:C2H2-type domain-containing protein n=1 Tax=Anopheles atroparvus TaxID=41427 RepID=A0AAG5DJ04_ANOAO